MEKTDRSTRFLTASLAAAVLLGLPAALPARSAADQEARQEEQQDEARPQAAAEETGQTPADGSAETRPAPAPIAMPSVNGTVLTWNGYRIDLKTPEGKKLQVAVNENTERLVEIEPGAEVTIEYRRKIGDFVIAERVRPVQEAGTAAQSGDAAPGAGPGRVTGTVVSWTNAALVLRTDAGEVTVFLSPRTESLVKPFAPGLPVAVEYQETASGAWLATRIEAAVKAKENEKPKEKSKEKEKEKKKTAQEPERPAPPELRHSGDKRRGE